MRWLLGCALALVLVPAAQAASPGTVHAGTGAGLYQANCARCHGAQGNGLTGQGPSLKDAGALRADFYLRTGYMPLGNPHDQPSRSRVLFTEGELRALVGFVASLGHGPAIPSPHEKSGSRVRWSQRAR